MLDILKKKKMTSILVIDDEPDVRNFLKKDLGSFFGLIEIAQDIDEADVLRQRCRFDLIILETRLPGVSGVEWISELRAHGSMIPVIFMAAYADLEMVIGALRAGAADFLMKPFDMEQMVAAVNRSLESHRMLYENPVLGRQADQYVDTAGMIGSCDLMKSICEIIKRIAPMPSTVLIEGESGTGKELVARAIHARSKRSGNFVPVNCGAMTAELLESELFGHIKGAFTGAHQGREGLFSYANSGTLFLDEIGEMPMSMQTHLLRVLEERSIRPVGSNREISVDVRILAASNRDLLELVNQGKFREDLYYRLNVLTVHVPALRERLEDLPALAQHFFNMLAVEIGVPVLQIQSHELARLAMYDWPGNVRELKNVIERCLLLNIAPSQCITKLYGSADSECDSHTTGSDLLQDIEKQHILKILEQQGSNKSAAARVLGVSRKTLERKVRNWEAG